MSWGEIKKAINSTLGTSNFKSLDKILTDLIFNNKSLVASDNPYYIIEPSEASVSTRPGIVDLSYKIRFKNQGSIRISVELKASASSTNTRLYILVNNVQVATLSSDYTVDGYVTRTADISIPASGVLSFQMKGSTSSAGTGYFKKLEIHANVVDSSLLENITE